MSIPNPCPSCGETIIHRTDEIGPRSRGSYHWCSKCSFSGPQRRDYEAALDGWNQLALAATVLCLVPNATPERVTALLESALAVERLAKCGREISVHLYDGGEELELRLFAVELTESCIQFEDDTLAGAVSAALGDAP